MALASAAGLGNPSSLHWAGRAARGMLEDSRERISSILGGGGGDLYFTSGGTEANRLAVLGALAARRGSGGRREGDRAHAVVSAIEHPSTLDLCRQLAEEERLDVTWVGAGTGGRVDPLAMAAAIRPDTRLVCLLHANNETGVVQDLAPLASACLARGVLLHSDAVQSVGKIELSLDAMGADLVSVSSHKIGGPKGVGALWVRRGSSFAGPWRGGPQERGLRPGTEDLPGIAGFACALLGRAGGLGAEVTALRERLWEGILSVDPEAVRNGDPGFLLPNTLNVSFPGVPSELLLIRLDLEGVAASSGSACASGARKPSHVLLAMGLSAERVESAVRFSLGSGTTREDIDRAVEATGRAIRPLRRGGPPAPRASGASPRSAPGTPSTARGTAPGRP